MDVQKFQTFYQEKFGPIYRYVYSQVGNRDVAEDLTSEIFLKAGSHIDRERSPRSMQQWLYLIARTTIADYWRGLVPVVVPLTLLRHYVRMFDVAYLAGQTYLQLAATSKHEADIMVDVLRKKSFKAMAAEIDERPGTYRVLVGPITDTTANKMRADLQGAGFPGNAAIRRTF